MHTVGHADDLNDARRDGIERHSAGDLDLKSGCVSAMHADCVDALMHVIGICVCRKRTCNAVNLYRPLIVIIGIYVQIEPGELIV